MSDARRKKGGTAAEDSEVNKRRDVWHLAAEALKNPSAFLPIKPTDDAKDADAAPDAAGIDAPAPAAAPRVPGLPSGDSVEHTHVLFAGQAEAGKTSVINAMLNKKEDPASSNTRRTVLDYAHGRRTNKLTGQPIAVAHVWELAGGLPLRELARFPLNAKTVGSSCVAIVVDASRPADAVAHVSAWVRAITKTVAEARAAADAKGAGDAFRKYRDAAFDGHADERQVAADPGVPVVIIVGKYDLFLEAHTDFEQRSHFVRVMRLLAHTNRCSLAFLSRTAESSVKGVRDLLHKYAFRVGLSTKRTSSSKIVTDHNKFPLIPAGSDSFADILGDGSAPSDGVRRDWIARCSEFFGEPHDQAAVALAEGDTRAAAVAEDDWNIETDADTAQAARATAEFLAEYPESQIDILRAQKDLELQKYREKHRESRR